MKYPFQIRNEPRVLRAEPSRAVTNVLAILESFDDRNPEQSLADISRRLEIPKATALRHLLALEQGGYIVLDRKRQLYALGSSILLLARRYLENIGVLELVRPVLGTLARATGETAHFGILEGREVVYLEIAESPQRVRVYVRRGDRLPAHCVAAGKAILAHSSDDIRRGFLAGGLPALTEATITDPAAFEAELRVAEKRGFAINSGEWIEEVIGISAPVVAEERGIVGAIGVAGFRARMTGKRMEEIGAEVLRQARALSSLLGVSQTREAG